MPRGRRHNDEMPGASAESALMRVQDLTFDPKNPRRRTERGEALLQQSLQEVGAARSIVIDENNVILAGNGTVEAAGQIGISRVRIVEADGEEIIAVRRSGLTDEQKRRLSLLDNRTAELAEWDTEQLLEFDGLEELWTDWELQDMEIKEPAFDPGSIADQSRLDKKEPVQCPECGHEFMC